jgi:hypothetical protein
MKKKLKTRGKKENDKNDSRHRQCVAAAKRNNEMHDSSYYRIDRENEMKIKNNFKFLNMTSCNFKIAEVQSRDKPTILSRPCKVSDV